MAQIGLSGCSHWCSNLVPPRPVCDQKAIFSLFWPKFGSRRAAFGTFWVLQMALSGVSGSHHWCSKLVPPLPTRIRPSGPICVTKILILAYWPPFGPHRATFGTFLVLKMTQTGLSGCPYWCSNLVPLLPTQKKTLWADLCGQKAILVYFGLFLAPLGPYLRLSLSGKWTIDI